MKPASVPANPKIDIHTHILPSDWPDLKERYGYDGFVQLEHDHSGCAQMVLKGKPFRTVKSNCWDPLERIVDCDANQVDIQVLSTVPIMFSYWAEAKDALDLSGILNDHLASVIQDHPNRFAGLGTVPMQDPQLACQELERCTKELGLCGVQIGSHVNQWNLNEPELFVFFETAEKLGASIFVHPWDMMAADDMRRYWLPWLVGMPAETSRAICSMIFGGVFERLPNLKVAFAHGGGSFPYTIGRIEHGFNVRPDLVAIDNDVNPREYLKSFYIDSLTHDAMALQYLIELFGVNQIALGSDYPFPLGEHKPGHLIETMSDIIPVEKARMLGGTAMEWLGWSDR